MKKLTFANFLMIIAALLAAAGAVVYTQVMYTVNVTYVFIAIVVVLALVALVIKPLRGFAVVANTALCASAIAWGTTNMVNQIGYVIAKLDTVSTIMPLIIFWVLLVVAMLFNLIASFGKQRA